jgi:hypothetical protein
MKHSHIIQHNIRSKVTPYFTNKYYKKRSGYKYENIENYISPHLFYQFKSFDTYSNAANAAYKNKEERQVYITQNNLHEYNILEESNQDVLVLQHKEDKSVIMAARGTDMSNATGNRVRDLKEDVHIAAGTFDNMSGRKHEIDLLYQKLLKKHKNVVLTGHSLGGRVATSIGNENKGVAIAFNEGSSPLDNVFNKKSYHEDVIHYRTSHDGVSYSSAQPHTHTIKQKHQTFFSKLKNAHTIENFTSQPNIDITNDLANDILKQTPSLATLIKQRRRSNRYNSDKLYPIHITKHRQVPNNSYTQSNVSNESNETTANEQQSVEVK